MNIAFSKILKINGRQWEFNFRKLPSASENFHVDVTDERGRRVFFQLTREDSGHWHTSASQVPAWIQQSEDMLGTVIDEETR
jgi:hypothetical protein